jgi:predicted nucleotidyltransferase
MRSLKKGKTNIGIGGATQGYAGDRVMVSREIIQEATKRLIENFDPERIILFGSYARGTADEHSDVDFMVLTRRAGKQNRLRMMTEMDEALGGLGIAKDIVVLTPEEFEIDKDIPGTIARYASKEGKLLYERKEKRRRKEGGRMATVRR